METKYICDVAQVWVILNKTLKILSQKILFSDNM